MALESYCAACTYLKDNADSYGKHWCTKKGENHYACDPKCYNFCEAYGRSNTARTNMYENSRNRCSGGGCYITTAMCEIIGYKDNSYYLETLRKFRDNVLKKDRKYWSLLIAYDIIGPTIANNLKNETMKFSMAMCLFNTYITRAVTAIEEEKYQDAINIYTTMTNKLAERYGINSEAIFIEAESIEVNDPSTIGHAR